jgi:hypothetical protein
MECDFATALPYNLDFKTDSYNVLGGLSGILPGYPYEEG